MLSILLQSTFLFLLWCPGLAVIMNPSNTIAVGYTQIVNGNLYVGSWVSFMCLCWMQSKLWGHRYNYSLAGVVQEKFRTRQGKWQALSAASVVVLASSVRVFHAFNCHLGVMKAAPTCQDSRVAIAVAVVAAVIAIMVTILGCFLTPSILQIGEYVGSILMLAFWGVGLGFITFGEGPVSRSFMCGCCSSHQTILNPIVCLLYRAIPLATFSLQHGRHFCLVAALRAIVSKNGEPFQTCRLPKNWIRQSYRNSAPQDHQCWRR